MSKSLTVALSTIFAAALLLASYSPAQQTINVETETASMQMPSIFTTDCTESLAVECVVDIEMTVKACAAAFESQGANIIADIKCAKDLLADKKHCWPCICAEAKKKGWHVIGC